MTVKVPPTSTFALVFTACNHPVANLFAISPISTGDVFRRGVVCLALIDTVSTLISDPKVAFPSTCTPTNLFREGVSKGSNTISVVLASTTLREIPTG